VKLVAVAVVAAAVGIGIAIAVGRPSENGGDARSLPERPVTSAPATTASTPVSAAPTTGAASATATVAAPAATDTAPQSATPAAIPQGAAVPQVRVISAVLLPAATARGQARRRARVTVRVRVTNRDSRALTPPNPLLLTGPDRIATDPRADDDAGALLRPIAPAASATGELRFEIAGAVTQRISAKLRARLAIVNRIVALKITISPTPPPPG